MTGPVGFVGLGAIGRPMALRLLDWPGGLWVYDAAPAPLDGLRAAGARVAGSVAELASVVDLVCVMVRDDEQVREVVGEVLGVARDGTTVAIHSTIAPGTAEQLADTALRHGVRLLDAPVSGGAVGAAEGTLTIMVGGPAEAYAACAAPLALMASRVVHAGPVGAGTRMKLARNLIHFVSFTAATEAQRLAEAAGLDLVELGRVVRDTDAVTGGPGAIMHRGTTATLDPGDGWFDVLGHVRALGEKDLGLVLDLADELGVDLPLARLARGRLGPGLGLPAETPGANHD